MNKRTFPFLKMLLGALVIGLFVGAINAAFLRLLSNATALREAHTWLLWGLPLLGLLTAFVYSRYGKGSSRGNSLVIDAFHEENIVLPVRMGAFAFLFTGLSHLFGASVGREGTAVQMGGVVGNAVGRGFRFSQEERNILLFCGVGAGFGSVFGTPLAGAVFGMEMAEIGVLHYEACLPVLLAAATSNITASFFGATHEHYSLTGTFTLEPRSVFALLVAALLFGVVARLFSFSIHQLKKWYARLFKNPYVRALFGSALLLAAFFLLNGIRYEGLSTWMIEKGFQGSSNWYDPLEKFVLTVLSLGAGFQGGEAVPLFDMGASLGGWLGAVFGANASLLAALGYVCIFTNAVNVPFTAVILGVELFGEEVFPYFVITACIGYWVSGHRGIYGGQRIGRGKFPWNREQVEGKKLEEL